MAEFTSAVLALVVAAHSTASATSRMLRTIKNADKDFRNYADEVAHFDAVVQILERQPSRVESALTEWQSQLDRQTPSICARARVVLTKVDQLNMKILGTRDPTHNSSRQLKKYVWLHHRSKMQRLIEEVRNLRLMLLTTYELQLMSPSRTMVADLPFCHRTHTTSQSGGRSRRYISHGRGGLEDCVREERQSAPQQVYTRAPTSSHITSPCCRCSKQIATILHPLSLVANLSGLLLIKVQTTRYNSACRRIHKDSEKGSLTVWIVWSLPAWLHGSLHAASASVCFFLPRLTINAALTGPILVPWQAPILKAAREKNSLLVRRLLADRSGSIHEVDEIGHNVMVMTLYRPGNLLEAKNLQAHAAMLSLWTDIGFHADDNGSGGTSTTIEILLVVVLVQRAKIGLWNDFASFDAVHCLCHASGLDAWDTWMALTSSLRRAPLMASLLRIDRKLPSFEDLVVESASQGNLTEMCNLGIWEVPAPRFIFTTPYLLVANSWPQPLRFLLRHGADIRSQTFQPDCGYQTLLHSLAGCAYWRAHPEADFLVTEQILLESGWDPNATDAQGETFQHNLVLLPYTTHPLELLHCLSNHSVDWLATNKLGHTVLQKYKQYWHLDTTSVGSFVGCLSAYEDVPGTVAAELTSLQAKDLSDGLDFVLARSFRRPKHTTLPSLKGRCGRHGRPHLHVNSFDLRETDPRMCLQWRDHHEEVINFLYEREQEQLARVPDCSSKVDDIVMEDTDWTIPHMPGSFE